jgi:hypothetical protein
MDWMCSDEIAIPVLYKFIEGSKIRIGKQVPEHVPETGERGIVPPYIHDCLDSAVENPK